LSSENKPTTVLAVFFGATERSGSRRRCS
jgi:hypothetical protein